MLTITPTTARRLAVTKQYLAGPRPAPGLAGLMAVMRGIRCLQIDPIRAIERTQYLVLFSRLGAYDPALLNQAAYHEKLLFEYWAHAASYVLSEDFALFTGEMKRAYQTEPTSLWRKRFYEWVAANGEFQQHILDTIRANGETLPNQISDNAAQVWQSSGWTNSRNTTMMLAALGDMGRVMVSRRVGLRKYWDLAERVLPDEIRQAELAEPERTLHAAQLSLKALGVGTARHIRNHFIRGGYADLERMLAQLERDHQIVRVKIEGEGSPLETDSVPWFIHVDDIPQVERASQGDWYPRTVLLSPFDNLICDRDRTLQLWAFFFRIEIYVPPEKREFGYYVLPILHGERLIGRVDARMNRKTKTLEVNAVFAEPGAPRNKKTARAVRQAIDELAAFLGAGDIAFGERIAEGWEAVK